VETEGNNKDVSHNIIELNGKQYDATSGTLLGESRVKATAASRKGFGQHRGRTLDGFIRQPNGAQPVVVKPSVPKISPKAVKSQSPKQFDITRNPSTALKPHQPERPKTLMRHVVSKPKTDLKPAIKTTAPSEVMARPTATLAKPLQKKMSVTQVNPLRLSRAHHIAKSHHIQRFSQDKNHQQQQIVAAPAPAPAIQQRPNQYANRPVTARVQHAPIVSQRSVRQATAQDDDRSAAAIFEAALAHAVSHEQTTPKGAKRHSAKQRKLINLTAGLAAFLVIGGFVTYLNLTNIQVHVASMKAGFHVSMPSFKPTGYALNGGVKAQDGLATLSFRSGDSAYTVAQEPSDWNSTTLLDQTTAERGKPTQTVQSNGRIIYIYNGTDATWVNGGVLYKVSGNATLDTNEIVSLATSM
jgi:hypothetical protein